MNGQLVIDQESATVTAHSSGPSLDQYTHTDDQYGHITSSSFSNRVPSEKWGEEETEKFYSVRVLANSVRLLVETTLSCRMRLL